MELSRRQFVKAACLASVMAFLLMFGYEINRSAIESLFLAEQGYERLPWVWVLVAIASAGAVVLQNRLANRIGVLTLFTTASVFFMVVGIGLIVLRRANVFFVDYALYVWKDVYVILMVELVWSLASLIHTERQAKWTYGLFCAIGSLGSIVGGFLLRPMVSAVQTQQTLGSINVLWIPIPIFLILGVLALWEKSIVGSVGSPPAVVKHSWRAGIAAIKASDYLHWLLLVVFLVQLTITLVDYQYKQVLQAAFPNTDVRSGIEGQINGSVGAVAFGLQLLTPFLLHTVGVVRVLMFIPVILILGLAAFLASPIFAVMAVVKVASKAFDYSLFRASKEMLYLPLSYAEKVQGKPVIDVFAYRFSKGGAALITTFLQATAIQAGTVGMAILLSTGWLVSLSPLLRRYRSKTLRSVEPGVVP